MNKSKFSTLNSLFSSFSTLALDLLFIGNTIVITYLFALLFVTASTPDMPPNALANAYSPSLEHIVMSLTLTVVGALSADIAERKSKR